MSEKQTKTWQKIKVFDTYGEADTLRTELKSEDGNSDLEIKIRRCGPNGTQFKVKTHRPKTNK
tara:strand:+ start:2435 stop:2623 length:189 start_codon:yes stop_codon:yes gene_type:complete